MWPLLIISGPILIVLVITLRIRSYNKFWKHIMAIPGPKDYPIIGNLFSILADPATLFLHERKRSKLYYPIYKLWSFNLCVVRIICPEDIEVVGFSVTVHTEDVAKYFDTLRKDVAGSKWHTRRKILTPAFHFNILQEFVNIFNKETESLVEVLAKECYKPYIDVTHPITEYTLNSIAETSLGVNLNEEKSSIIYKRAVNKYGHSAAYRTIRPWFYFKPLYKLMCINDRNVVKVLHDFSTNIIMERKKLFKANNNMSYSLKKRLAMLDLLLTAKNNGADIDDEGIREEVDTFIFEGYDTTAMGICYSLMALANEKSIQEEILKEIYEILGHSGKTPTYNDLMEMKFMERCIKECLRLYPSVPFIARITGEDIKTHTGYTIPKDTNVHIYIYDLHHLPQYWENPEKFDPDRFLPENIANRHPFAYLPFSAGPRNCIGQKYAILEIKAALCGILRKFKLEAVDTPQSLRFTADLVLRPFDKIRVKFVPRK